MLIKAFSPMVLSGLAHGPPVHHRLLSHLPGGPGTGHQVGRGMQVLHQLKVARSKRYDRKASAVAVFVRWGCRLGP